MNRPTHSDPEVEYVIYTLAAPPFYTGGFDDIESLLKSIGHYSSIAGTTNHTTQRTDTPKDHDWCQHYINRDHVSMVIDLRKDN